MGGKVTHVTDATFESTVVNSDKPAMVDFWATWCGPCRMIAPHVEALADEYTGKAVVAKLDVDSNRQTAIKFGIQSIPTLLFFKGGKVVDRVIGAVDKKVLKEKLTRSCEAARWRPSLKPGRSPGRAARRLRAVGRRLAASPPRRAGVPGPALGRAPAPAGRPFHRARPRQPRRRRLRGGDPFTLKGSADDAALVIADAGFPAPA